MRNALVVLLLLASCRRDAVVTKPHDPEARHEEPDAGALPRVRVLADIAEHHGKRAVVEALYEIQPFSGGKGRNLVWLVLVDGTRISRAYAAIDDELPYANRRVLATGVITSGPSDEHVQALMAPHLKVERIELAVGQPPLDKSIVSIPTPPVASTTPALGKDVDRWVQVVATLAALTSDEATLKLSDGGTVRVEHVHAATWSPHLGHTVTVTGRVAMEKGTGSAFALDLVIRGPTAICAGIVAKCGM